MIRHGFPNQRRRALSRWALGGGLVAAALIPCGCQVVGGFDDFEVGTGQGGAGGNSNLACEGSAPPDAADPEMVAHPMPDGQCLWIDSTEVSRTQYREFLDAAQPNPSAACSLLKTGTGDYVPDSVCAGSLGRALGTQENTDEECTDGFDNDDDGQPDCADDDCATLAYCGAHGDADEDSLRTCADGVDNDGDGDVDCADEDCRTLENSLCDDPVSCVDWCDAEAFCSWAGKRLCREAIPSTEADAAADNEWFAACGDNAQRSYPYSDTRDPSACNLKDHPESGCSGGGSCELRPTGDYAACVTFDGAFDMLGNVGEWVDSCNGSGKDAPCRVRGGSVNDDGGACNQLQTQPRSLRNGTIGFRCCADG